MNAAAEEKRDDDDAGELDDLRLPHAHATYSPEDNKLRLYSLHRLDEATYGRIHAAGFRRAPKQDLFFAPAWTPERADLLLELCGEIGDEDTTLVERAEERADRFEGYSDNRAADADAARARVAAIADHIPLGQPILVGHHSERRARRDAERIQTGMRRAVDMWETSQYWERRAKGALRHAKYKELPGVRFRRIKGLEAELRKYKRTIADAELCTKLWQREGLTRDAAMLIAARDSMPAQAGDLRGDTLWYALDRNTITVEAASARAAGVHAARITYARRWVTHIENRLAYERAMLGEQGGTAADKFPIEVGGRVLGGGFYARFGWLVVLKVNRDAGGRISSVKTPEGGIDVERIAEYKAPEPGDVEKVKRATKLPPLVNYPGEGFRHMTKAEYDRVAKQSDTYSIRRVKASDKHGAHRLRQAPKVGRPYYDTTGVYLTDAKRVDPPAPSAAEPVKFDHQPAPAPAAPRPTTPTPTVYDEMKASLAGGVRVVVAPQLIPTPAPLAAELVERAGVEEHHRALEPSAGTGAIMRELVGTGAQVVALEINAELAKALQAWHDLVRCVDFLTMTAVELGTFDRIVMNPPFANGQDVDHVAHAFELLRAGGVLVAIMGGGVRWRKDKKTAAFRELVAANAGEIEDLPDDTFVEQGANVRAVVVTLRKAAA